jgi:hypothetical protein
VCALCEESGSYRNAGAEAVETRPFQLVSMTDGGFHGPDDFIARFRGRYLAVGTTYLYGGYIIENARKGQRVEKSALIAIRDLRALQPVARTTTFLIYDFTDERKLVAQ